jgi:ribosome biogenesis GTPase
VTRTDHTGPEQLRAHQGLVPLGWDHSWSAAATEAAGLADAGEVRPGRVVRADRGRCLVDLGTRTVHALSPAPDELAGSPADTLAAPTTGDWVLVDRPDSLDSDPRIVAVLPRRTAYVRGAGRTDTRPQVLAANLDVVAVVQALDKAPNLTRLERMLALAWSSGARPLVVLSKADLANHPETEREEVAAAAPGADVVVVSTVAEHPAYRGVDEIRAMLPAGTTAAFIGQSGVGKSTLLNALAGEERKATAPIRADGKGRHTTTDRELVRLPWGALLVDTPGLRGVQLWDADEGLDATFADVVELTAMCRFSDCAHAGEPGCAVAAALADGRLAPRRWESYQKLLREQRWLEMRYDARLRAQERAVWKRRSKEARSRGRP